MDRRNEHKEEFDGRAVWDEYRWESYIRQQDASADEYMALLEYYGDDPDSHNIIARSMGWDHLVTNCQDEPDPRRCQQCPEHRRQACQFHDAFGHKDEAERNWLGLAEPPAPEPDTALAEACEGEAINSEPEPLTESDPLADSDEQAAEAEWNIRYSQHPVRQLTRELVSWLSRLCQELPQQHINPQSPMMHLLHYVHYCSGKVAGALGVYCEPEATGMVIAYLKIAFHAACVSLGHIRPSVQAGQLPEAAAEDMSRRLAAIRTQLAELIDEFRLRLDQARGF